MMQLSSTALAYAYLAASILFIFGLKGLTHPASARRGNMYAMLGMAIAIGATLMSPEIKSYTWIIPGIIIGAVIGAVIAAKIQMTAMPQLVAALHSFVGLTAVLVAIGTYFTHSSTNHIDSVLLTELVVGSFIGAITFTGSIIAFGKLQGIIASQPVVFKGQHWLNLALGIVMVGCSVYFIMNNHFGAFLIVTAIALGLGILLIIPIGGADMPVVVSMLNSYSGWAAAATGFTLQNNLLIITGALVGFSGAILSYIMCKAMNRSFISVILGGFGETGEGDSANAAAAAKGVKSAAAEDAAFMMENASKILIVPGYGMAVAQAQHAAKELMEVLLEKDIEVKFAIHPVAGRMPGHMNVLLAEADVPYDHVFELEDINSEFSTADVALIVGANDVVNPAAKTDKSSPIYGMPILEAHRAKYAFAIKRSMRPGYSGVENLLYYQDNCSLIFGDAKAVLESLVAALRAG